MTFPVVLLRHGSEVPLNDYMVYDVYPRIRHPYRPIEAFLEYYDREKNGFVVNCGAAIMDCLEDPEIGGEIVVRVNANWLSFEIIYEFVDEISRAVFLLRHGAGLP